MLVKFVVLCSILSLYLSIVSHNFHLVAASNSPDGDLKEAADTTADEIGQSRAGLFSKFKNFIGSMPLLTHKSLNTLQPNKTQVLNQPKPTLTTLAPATTMKPISEPAKLVETKQYTREQLESALDIPGVKCGTVPLFEKSNHKSINESLAEEEKEAKESQGDFRIINGLDSMPGEWPWIVRISECLNANEDECFTCTGTLLNNRWIISAGHCGFQRSAVKNFNATLGLYDMVSPDKSAFTTTIDKIIVHPDYKELNNDLALFRLTAPVSFSDFVQPACLIKATRNVLQYTHAKRCYAVGYGLTAGMVAAVKLQKLRIKPKQPSECNSDQLGYVQLRSNTVCIGVPEGKTGATCKGDSGGPDLCYDAKLNRWELFGTVSYGPADCDRDTGEKWLTVSVDVSNYRTWILSTILANN